jgi:hypothetical protein
MIGNLEGGAALLVILTGAMVFIAAILPLLFFSGYLIAGTVGLQVQREVVAEIRTGQQGITGFLRLGLFSGLVALGLEIGFLITPIPIFSPLGSFWGDAASDLVLMIPWIFFWLIGTYSIYLVWPSICSLLRNALCLVHTWGSLYLHLEIPFFDFSLKYLVGSSLYTSS